MPMKEIKMLLKKVIGLHFDTIGISALKHATKTRMDTSGHKDIQTYSTYLKNSPDEQYQLIEELVVPETWFFRDKLPFETLREVARQKLLSGKLSEKIRILSLPSSTGEEPYSIAMTLLDAGLNPSQFIIDAFDISENALSRARLGKYRENSFRGKQEQHIIDRYFKLNDTLYELSELVKRQVIFKQGNIFDVGFLPQADVYDIVFCRNLLIYFDANDKKKAFVKLERSLKKDGLLFLGHSESGIVPEDRFSKFGKARSFAYTYRTPEDKTVQKKTIPVTSMRTEKKFVRSATPTAVKTKNRQPIQPVKKSEPVQKKPPESLEKARRLADSGSLDDAKAICLQHLSKNSDDTQAHFLLGLICVASGNETTGEQYYRKALYLDPKHYETLIHLSLLLDKQGNKSGADLLRRRAERASKENA